jgi:hypothetical protein
VQLLRRGIVLFASAAIATVATCLLVQSFMQPVAEPPVVAPTSTQ